MYEKIELNFKILRSFRINAGLIHWFKQLQKMPLSFGMFLYLMLES